MEAQKYLRKSCYHRIEYPAANFLATFIWRKSLNNVALTTPIHRGSEKMSNGTSTQVIVWMINKWRAKINQGGVYNVRKLKGIGGGGGGRKTREKHCSNQKTDL